MERYNIWRESQGLAALANYVGPKRPRSVTMSDGAYNDLRRMALSYGHISNKGRPSVSGQEVEGAGVSEFLEALAGGCYRVEPNT